MKSEWNVVASIPPAPLTSHPHRSTATDTDADADAETGVDIGELAPSTEPQPRPQPRVSPQPAESDVEEGWSSSGREWLIDPTLDDTGDRGDDDDGVDAGRGHRRTGRVAVSVAVGVVAAGVLAAAAGAVWLTVGTGHHRHGTHSVSVPSAAVIRAGVLPCPQHSNSGGVVTGNGIGGMWSGPDTILWFEHAYYDARSASQALEVTAPDAVVSPQQTIQAGIDTTPTDTSYCVTITPASIPSAAGIPPGDTGWDAVVTEQTPAGHRHQYRLHVTTHTTGNSTLITSLTAGDGNQQN